MYLLFETYLSVNLGEALPILNINYQLQSPENSFHIWLLVIPLRFMNSWNNDSKDVTLPMVVYRIAAFKVDCKWSI